MTRATYFCTPFAIDYTFWLNLVFLAITGVLAWLRFGGENNQNQHHHSGGNQDIIERILYWLAMVSYIWLAGGAGQTHLKLS